MDYGCKMGFDRALRVLVVDDCDDFRQLVLHYLRRIASFDMNIYQANDEVEAMTVIEELDPHIVITDLPRMNGIELPQFIKSKSNQAKLIVIVQELDDSSLTGDTAEVLGAELVVTKQELRNKLLPYLDPDSASRVRVHP